MKTKPDHIEAHKYSSRHRHSLMKSDLSGCFYCLAIFNPSKIVDWTDEGTTALCPKCGIDSVIGSASGFPIQTEFLKSMQRYWFSKAVKRGLS